MMDLPLRSSTPAAWAARVLAEPTVLLNDHAHLEKKAASNALELMHRSHHVETARWTAAMTGIARDEIEHLAAVLRMLHARGGKMTKHHRNPYAAALRKLVRAGGRDELIDRLLVSALIELRSCERFSLLAAASTDRTLAKFYTGLHASEAGHYRVFVKLAGDEAGGDSGRWDQLLAAEADIIAAQPIAAGMHSGPGA